MKILLTGAAGLLGAALLPRLAPEHDVVATFHQEPLKQHPAITTIQIDLALRDEVILLFHSHEIDCVINCAGAVDVDRCETDHDYAQRGNRDLVANLLAAQQEHDFRLVHISTDYVFDGSSGPPDETVTPNPINFYGKSKLAGEELIRVANRDYCIVRVCALYSTDLEAKSNLYSKILAKLRGGESYPAATDLFNNPTEVSDLAAALVSLAKHKQLPPLLHLASPEYLSRYDFAQQIARFNGLDESLVTALTSDKIEFAAPRPNQAGLDSRLAEKKFSLRVKPLTELLRG